MKNNKFSLALQQFLAAYNSLALVQQDVVEIKFRFRFGDVIVWFGGIHGEMPLWFYATVSSVRLRRPREWRVHQEEGRRFLRE